MLLRTYDSASPLTDAGTLTSWLVQIGGGVLDLVGWEVLDTAECLRLLARVPIGRVISPIMRCRTFLWPTSSCATG